MNKELIEYNVKFKDISGYIGTYQITDDGRVYNKKYQRFLKPAINSTGYLGVGLCGNGPRKTYTIHRLVANAFLNNYENKPFVDHINGNITDNNINNLRFATPSENSTNRNFAKNKKIQIKGVYKTNFGFFQAQIKKGDKKYHKNFKTLEEAINWRKVKEIELHGEFSYKG